MTAQGFGRKGMIAGVAAQRRKTLVSDTGPRSFEPIQDVADPDEEAEARRTAFLAQERARSGAEAAPAPLPAAETEQLLASLKAETPPPPTDRSLRTAYLIWFFLGLGGGHRFYLRHPWTGAAETTLLIGCLGAVAIFQYYPAFAGLALSWVCYLVDGIRLKRLHLWSGRE